MPLAHFHHLRWVPAHHVQVQVCMQGCKHINIFTFIVLLFRTQKQPEVAALPQQPASLLRFVREPFGAPPPPPPPTPLSHPNPACVVHSSACDCNLCQTKLESLILHVYTVMELTVTIELHCALHMSTCPSDLVLAMLLADNAMQCNAMQCNAMQCNAMLCNAMLCYAMLCYAMLCYAMLCYAMLCYAMLCYAMLCYASRMLLWSLRTAQRSAAQHAQRFHSLSAVWQADLQT